MGKTTYWRWLYAAAFWAAASQATEFVKVESDGIGSFETISHISQDADGLIWLAANPRGLLRYDGSKFEVIKPTEGGDAIGQGFATGSLADGKSFWLTTRNGINVINSQSLQNRLYRADRKAGYWPAGLPQNDITDIAVDPDGVKWILGSGYVLRFDDETGQFNIVHDGAEHTDPILYTADFDPEGWLWVSRVDTDFLLINRKTGEKRTLTPGKEIPEGLLAVESLLSVGEYFLIGTPQGLWKLHYKTLIAERVLPESIAFPVTRLAKDRFGNIWLAGLDVYRLSSDLSRLEHFPIENSEDMVFALYPDREGNIWVGGDGIGLYKYTATGQEAVAINPFKMAGITQTDERVRAIAGLNDHLWLATTAGLISADLRNSQAKQIGLRGKAGGVRAITSDKQAGIFWAITDKELLKLSSAGDLIQSVALEKGFDFSVSQPEARALAVDSNGDVWIAFGEQVGRFDARASRLLVDEPWLPEYVIRSGYVSVFSVNEGKNILFTAYGYGAYVIDPKTRESYGFTHADHKEMHSDVVWAQEGGESSYIFFGDGHPAKIDHKLKQISVWQLPINGVTCVAPAPTGWWLAQAGGGIQLWEPQSGAIRSVGLYAPAASKTVLGAGCATFNGDFIAPTHAGLLVIPSTSKAVKNDIPPRLVIKSAHIDGRRVVVPNELWLKPQDAGISLSLAGTSFADPGANRYRYRLIGLHDWVEVAADQSIVTYPVLEPGDYVFEGMAANNDGLWGQAMRLPVSKAYPALSSPLARSLYLVAALLLLLGFSWMLHSRKQQKLTLAEEARKHEALVEFARFRERFFLWISHDLRTPLTPIILETEDLTEKSLPSDVKQSVGRIRYAALHLREMVESLLDVARLKQGVTIKPVYGPTDVHELVSELTELMVKEAAAVRKSLKVFVSSNVSGKMQLDQRRCRQILGNLLKNALRAAPTNTGVVELQVDYSRGRLIFRVTDNGPGIPADVRPHLFEDFAQSQINASRGGFGLGLSASNYFAQSMGGALSVESTGLGGTVMLFELPAETAIASATSPSTPGQDLRFLALSVLVVDDSLIIRNSIGSLLSGRVDRVALATGTEEAEKLVKSRVPDVMIVDYSLEGSSETGVEFVRRIRREGFVFPVILLSGATAEITGDTDDMEAVLLKPARKAELFGALAGVMPGPR